ncbi:hypothetical protein Leryth_022642 [Lithospermum erythrorhizon]|nr:hypothetical protein Leryth_022642 [Lithospermum erythrorhizon]
MNDPAAQMMNQHQQIPTNTVAPPQQQQPQMMNQSLPQMINNVQFQSQQQMMMNQPPTLPPSSQMMNRSYGMWVPPPQMAQPSLDQMTFQKHPNPKGKGLIGVGGFGSGKLQNQPGVKSLGPRNNWKGKGKRVIGGRRNDNINMALAGGSSAGGIPGGSGGGGGGYQPPTLNELQHQNRVKARRFFPKKKYNSNYHTNYNNNNNGGRNMGKFAPRNTTSFLIRAKKSGGIAELVSPYPVTPAVLPTPMFSPSKEVLVDMAKEEWGVDGYGSMKGLIRLRSPGREDEGDDDDDDEGESSESDVEDHVEVERRLDHDLSRFEMIYPNNAGGMDYNNLLENRVDDQDTHIAHLEEENLILKDRLFLMDRELVDLRRRLRYLERRNHGSGEVIHEEVLENESDSETESRGESRLMGVNHEEFVEENTEDHRDIKMGEELEGDMKVSKGNDENAADASLDNSIELENKTDTDNDEIPSEREVSNRNDESVIKTYNQASVLMDEIQGKRYNP